MIKKNESKSDLKETKSVEKKDFKESGSLIYPILDSILNFLNKTKLRAKSDPKLYRLSIDLIRAQKRLEDYINKTYNT